MPGLGVAVVGAGYWGPNLVRNFQASPDFRLRWLCDLDEDRARARARRPTPPCAPPTSLADGAGRRRRSRRSRSPRRPRTHLDVALAALEAGKHVLVEKPLAPTYAEGADAGRPRPSERGLVLMCDHTYCYTPAVAQIRELVHARRARRPPVRRLGADQPRAGPAATSTCSGTSPRTTCRSSTSSCPTASRPVAVAAHGADPIGAGRACVGYLTLPLAERRHRARPRQLAAARPRSAR